jgi:hypothetical protein
MLKVTRSTERAIRSGVKPNNLGALQFDYDLYQQGLKRARDANTVMSYGCLTCCELYSTDGPSRIRCPLLVTTDPRYHLEPEERAKAEACKVPQLYADVEDGRIMDVKGEDVLALIPEFLSLDQLRELVKNAAQPSLPLPPQPPQPQPEQPEPHHSAHRAKKSD